MDRRKSRHHGLATFFVDDFAANCLVRKERCVAAVARGPFSQHTNSLLRTEAIASFGRSSLVYQFQQIHIYRNAAFARSRLNLGSYFWFNFKHGQHEKALTFEIAFVSGFWAMIRTSPLLVRRLVTSLRFRLSSSLELLRA